MIFLCVGFNYDLLETKVPEQARSRAERIGQKTKKTLESISDGLVEPVELPWLPGSMATPGPRQRPSGCAGSAELFLFVHLPTLIFA